MAADHASRARVDRNVGTPLLKVERRAKPPDRTERCRLRWSLGMMITRERLRRGWRLVDLAGAADLGVSTISELEAGRLRPSEATCRALAGALRPHADPVTVAVLDLQLRRAAGESLQRWRRRKPLRRSVQRTYAEASSRLAELDRKRAALSAAEIAATIERVFAQSAPKGES